MTQVAQGLRYTKTHEWVKLDGDVATVGVTDFAQSELGDITYLELPEPGTTVTQGEPMGVIESVKAASDIYAPISGEVIEANSTVVDSPELVNSSPYEEGWFVKVRVSDPAGVESLMDADAYEAFVKEEGGA
ncbi:glycine cleavage system protein GcvH [Sphaerobacter thermophilus]|jgi:glycine cleavage system H protein|uniref:Glycine cleavage system H protein n=1 Tax=Sphaerobacter thermophilus (strain ATCC 49802 / DSM 20745 / KCCM 41009 / NCIMB 13125 / S 6022) TaxID=479434 RepID=D1C3A4_SPHTD|nr:glycine cleavage system protein GcvH [Sphaerobacter thermophilus]ACZ38721.1 glycine cleavage system H protein [Sphaerobacter thermophilus DSM 20745]PZN67370.1 MAG: glycine cleavage system protein GcvH [Sphaerobacter thermophilus]